MRVAVVSDIHGNLAALEAVLADIALRSVDAIVNLGDAVSGPLFPAECADRLMPLGFPTVRGNHERQLLTQATGQMSPSDRYAASCLRSEHRAWLAGFPEMLLLFDDVLLTHGTPANDSDYLLDTVDENGLRAATREEVEARTTGTDAAVILCGHSHVPRIAQFGDGRLAVNPGSVGLQAYEAAWPLPHKVETGSPHARYAVIDRRGGAWSAELLTVAYDWESAAEAAESRGRSDWARALRTGLA
jgi:predicted phosphodiesterase